MLNKERVIYLTVIAISISSLVYAFTTSIRTYTEYEETIDRLHIQSDSLMNINIELDYKLTQFQQQADSLDKVLDSLNTNIIQIKEDAKNSIARVDTLGHQQLLQFFTDRYN